MITKHTKPSAWQIRTAVSLSRKDSIDISNVMYLHNGKATRVGFKMDGRQEGPCMPRLPAK